MKFLKHYCFCSYGNNHNFDLEKRHAHLLRICAEKLKLSEGRSLHSSMLKTIPDPPPTFVSNSLMNMYANCGAIRDAHQVFDEIPQRDIVSWNTMISGYIRCGLGIPAFKCFKMMVFSGSLPDQFTFTAALKACSNAADFRGGLQLHSALTKHGLNANVCVGSALVDFYAKLNALDESIQVFDSLVSNDVVLINTIISVHGDKGNFEEAFKKFRLILSSSLIPTRASFLNLLSVIDSSQMSKNGLQIHGLIIKLGFEGDDLIENSLVGMYIRINRIDDSYNLLVDLGSQNIMSWTTLIAGYASYGSFGEAAGAFYHFYCTTRRMDSIILACVLSVCAASECLELGSQLHSIVVQLGFESDSSVQEAVMDMYAKCSLMADAVKFFQQMGDHHDLLSWTTLLSGYVHNGFSVEALRIFCKIHREGLNPDVVACISILKGCNYLEAIDHGKQTHAYALKSGCETDISVQTALLSLYADCGSIDSAIKLFENMTRHDVISWTSLVSGFTKLGYHEEALVYFVEMLKFGVKPNQFTLSNALAASTKLTAIENGKSLHAHIIKIGLQEDKFVGSAIIDMYSKCGSIENAVSYFTERPTCDTVVWNALLAGHAHHGNGAEILKSFQEMQASGVRPDKLTFLSVLSGCSHAGLIECVMLCFDSMQDEYKITPGEEHYACVVDALGRAQMFKEVIEFIKETGFEPSLVVLRTLMSSCCIYGYVRLGLAVAAKVMELGENDTASYVMLANLYASTGRWNEAKKAREVMEKICLRGKEAGKSWIEEKYDVGWLV